MALVEHVLLEHLVEDPPHRLDVRIGEREVRVVVVEPEAEPLARRDPLTLVRTHALKALVVESLYAVLLDVFLAREAELLFDGDLNRQAVRIPASLSGHVAALHGAKARDNVLDRSRKGVADVGDVVRGRWALEEDERLSPLRLLNRLLEDLTGLQGLDDLSFRARKVLDRRWRGEGSGGHGRSWCFWGPLGKTSDGRRSGGTGL